MIIREIAWDKNDQPTLYKSSAVFTMVDGKRVLANPGFIAPTLQEVATLVQHSECSFESIWVESEQR